jgi:RNA polymerase sigma-70 factor (ECF subfamily)
VHRAELDIGALYDEFADDIYRFLCWHTSDAVLAEDLTSEVFIRAWKHRDTLRADQLRAWLYRVARNLTIDHYRRIHDKTLDESVDPTSDYDLHAEAEKHEASDQLHSALARLSNEHRTIVILRFFTRLSAKEVAQIMGKSEGNIRILQYRALKELKKDLSREKRNI